MSVHWDRQALIHLQTPFWVLFLSVRSLDAKACPSGEFMCANRKCLAIVHVCDGDDDCGDGSDELKCTSPLTCGPNHLRCNTSECVPLIWSCDGDPDCSDSSDEGPERCGGDGVPYLPNRRTNCTAGEFRCANGECVRLTWKCDGDPDCKDKSDESDCREFLFLSFLYISLPSSPHTVLLLLSLYVLYCIRTIPLFIFERLSSLSERVCTYGICNWVEVKFQDSSEW